jgi:hypothetical protein
MTEEQVRQIIRDELANIFKTDRIVFDKKIQILDNLNIQLGRRNGTSIGMAADQLLSVYGVTPVNQGDAITNPSGGLTVDSEARNALTSLLNRIRDFGIIAT